MYAVLDRAFAWIHVPGTPAFVGELTIALGVLALFASSVPMVAAIRRSPARKALLAWMIWVLVFLVLQLPGFGLDAMRNSALWHYGIAAVFVVFLLLSGPIRFGRWADGMRVATLKDFKLSQDYEFHPVSLRASLLDVRERPASKR